MVGLRSRAVALALVLAMVLAACGGGDAETEAGGDAGDRAKSDTSEPVEGDGGDAGTDPGTDAAPDDGAEDPADGATPAPATDAGQGGGAAPAAPPASTAGGAPAAAAPTDADALAHMLRVEDLPKGYQQSDESVGANEQERDFEEAFRKCMGVAGADQNAAGAPSGQGGRSFSEGAPNPQDPSGITSGVLGFADGAAPERMVAELGKLFASEPGRECIAEEIRKVIDAQVKAMSPTASSTVEAKQVNTYSAAGGIAQLQLEVTVDFGAQEFVFFSDIVVVRAGRFASLLGFTESNAPFDPKVGQPIVDKALARLAG